jgi:hypothetical protein
MIIREAQDALGADLSSTLNAIRKELSLLNEKASKSEEVIPPSKGGTQ